MNISPPFPLFHLITLLNTFFCLFASGKLYFSYRKTKNINIKYFLGIFFPLVLYFGFASLPGTVVNDPVWVQVIYVFIYVPLFYTGIAFLRLAHSLLRFKLALYGIYTAYIGTAILSILTAILFYPANRIELGPWFFYWQEGTPAWLQSINVVFIGTWALACSLMFFWAGLRIENEKLRYRSFLIGTGIFLIIMSGFVNYIFAVVLGNDFGRFLSAAGGAALSLLALVVLLYGIYYKVSEPE